ncbi:MAG: hypothetical protein ABWY78_04985 [Microvirga sp.]
MLLLERLLERFWTWWRPPPLTFIELPPSAPLAPLPPPPAPEVPQVPPVPPRRKAKYYSLSAPPASDTQEVGDTAFRFREDLLDQLDGYMAYIRRMKKSDKQAYELYHRVGGQILPRSAYIFVDPKFTPRWRAGYRGSFACVAIAPDEKYDSKKSIPPRFLYYQKINKIPGASIEHVEGGSNYLVVAHFDRRDDKRWRRAYPFSIFVNIDDQCQLRVLRESRTLTNRIRHRKRVPGYANVSVVAQGHCMDFDREWTRQAKRRGEDIHTYVAGLFCMIAEAQERGGMVRVAATREHCTAVFTVDVEHTPRFFRDRQAHFNEAGNKKRIFHIVRAHMRNGKATKLHFRGERDFEWNGYHVHITVPGRHHPEVSEFDGELYADTDPGDRSFVGTHRFARTMQRRLNS